MDLVPIYPILFLRTNDMNKTRNFYEHILNFPVALEQSGCIIYQVGDYGYWGFCQSEEKIEKPEQVCLTLVVDSREKVDNWHIHLEKSKVEIKRDPQYTSQYKIYNGFYIDPTGYILEIQVFDKDGEPKGHDNFK